MNLHGIRQFLGSTTFRLASSYLLIIMVLSIAFSAVIYQVSWHEIGRQVPPPSFFGQREEDHRQNDPDYQNYFKQRINEGRGALVERLVILNVGVLVGGAFLSYLLARRTLEPIEDVMHAQSRFVTDASHELRTPLTALLATNEVALRKPKLGAAEARNVIQSNTEELTKLKDLSDGLLSLAVSRGKLVREPVALATIVSDAVDTVEPYAAGKQIEIQAKLENLEVVADRMSLTQALVILLDNAIKYSPDKTQVTIETKRKGKAAQLRVIDQGIGIDQADLPHIFDRFYRVDNSRSKQTADGYGIGLSIAQNISLQHQGKLTAESQSGKGSTFTITLPLA
jgi:two-component system sensor histidine kinase CiaH